MSLIDEILSGNRSAISRFLTKVEDDPSQVIETLSELYFHSGKAHLIGITGASGTGKSSLVNQLGKAFRNSQLFDKPPRVGIIAVDPSSPFTGGALLGDRIRMRDLVGDPGVFIRSTATRGVLGGLAASTSAMTQVLDAAGYSVIFIETVGAGQSEVEIANLAHTTIVVEAPGMGDDIQAIKAGIMEIADILVINKADLGGVDETERVLKANMLLAHGKYGPLFSSNQKGVNLIQGVYHWVCPIIRTVATTGSGIEELAVKIIEHKEKLMEKNLWNLNEKRRLYRELQLIIRDSLFKQWSSRYSQDKFEAVFAEVLSRKISPWQAIELFTNKDNF